MNNKLIHQPASLEIEIVELDERLDMSIDPLASTISINGKCSTNNGCNIVAGCGGGGGGTPKPNQG